MDIPYGIKVKVAGLAREFGAVKYDAHDPFAAAIEAACEQAGIQAIADPHASPRSIKGAVATDGVPRDAGALAATLHKIVCLPQGGNPASGCDEDLTLATQIIDELAGRGWRLALDLRRSGVPG